MQLSPVSICLLRGFASVALLCTFASARDAAPATLPSFPTTAPSAPDAKSDFHVDLKQSIQYLASDELEGRMIGTAGIQRAADLIASDFSHLGLKTLPGLSGYFQPFEMTTSVDPDPTKTSLTAAGKTIGTDGGLVPLRFSAEKEAEGLLAFGGYGETNPEAGYDDFSQGDYSGKIVLIMRYEPHDPATGKSRFATGDLDYSMHAALQEKVAAAVKHGAAGVILVNPALHHKTEGLTPFGRTVMFNATVPIVQVTQAVADELLKQGGAEDLATLQKKIDELGKPITLALKDVPVKLSVGFIRTRRAVENVVGMVRGEGPHADEYVVVSAHYDHLGMGGANSLTPWVRAIHHGADDNGSGTVAMLGLADRFAHDSPPARSILFIACTGEEEGLVGSEYFVNHCPVALDKIVANLNLDMVGRVKGQKLLVGGMGTAAAFPEILKKADEGLNLTLGEFGKGGIGPSDHMSFAMKKIPVLFFYDQMLIDYHRPTDTADKINYEGLDLVVELGHRVTAAMAAMPRQTYNGSYDSQSARSGVSHGSNASLGVVPDYSNGEESTGGVRITGTVPNSAAEKAGLKEGDIILRFSEKKIDNLIDLTNALGSSKPGQTIKLSVKRDGKTIELEATLTERKG